MDNRRRTPWYNVGTPWTTDAVQRGTAWTQRAPTPWYSEDQQCTDSVQPVVYQQCTDSVQPVVYQRLPTPSTDLQPPNVDKRRRGAWTVREAWTTP